MLMSQEQIALIPVMVKLLTASGYDNLAKFFGLVNSEREFLRTQVEAANEFVDNLKVWMETYSSEISLEAKRDLFQRVELIIALYDSSYGEEERKEE